VAKRKAPLLDGEMLEHVSTVTNTTEEAMLCIESHADFLGNGQQKSILILTKVSVDTGNLGFARRFRYE
jgi:hypothetical protein